MGSSSQLVSWIMLRGSEEEEDEYAQQSLAAFMEHTNYEPLKH